RYRIPACGGRVAGHVRGEGPVVPLRDVEEIARVLPRVASDLVQRRVDQAQGMTGELVGQCDDSGPLRAGERGAADVVPAGAARNGATEEAAVAVRWEGEVHERARPRARLERDVRHATLVRGDRSAPRRQDVLVGGPREDAAEAASGVDPADL